MNWHEIHKTELVEENLISGIHLVELLEKDSKYHTSSSSKNYFLRLKETLEYIPEKHHEAALAIFSNVIYIPMQLLDQTFSYFWKNFLLKNKIDPDENRALEICHFFEVDPSGMTIKFCHENSIHQRLHQDYFIRILDIDNLKDKLISSMHNIKWVVDEAKNSITKLFQKEHWIIFTDKALSGQSLFKDIERFIFARKLALICTGNKLKITIFAQIITEDALKMGKEKLKNEDDITLKYGILFDDSMKINSDNCNLFNNKNTHEKVKGLCNWFVKNILDFDTEKYSRMRDKSRDNLEFGYKGCGLTLVDHANCPTNSIPLLWYDNLDYCNAKGIAPYKGPFPRVHSRLGSQKNELTENGWNFIFENEKKIIDILKVL
jgi:hypothetical protein